MPEEKDLTPAEDIPAGQQADFSEVGLSGLNRAQGTVLEDFLPALRWPQVMKVYREMSMNDPTIGAILFAAEQLIRKVTWDVTPGDPSDVAKEAAEFLKSCLHDMSTTWSDTITEILTMLPFGFSFHEIVYKKREGQQSNPRRNSRYNDGRIGWRRLPGRAQETIREWLFDEDGGIAGAMQESPPDFQRATIPIEKALLFRTKAVRNNPEGYSILRNAYRPWYFKKHIEEIEGIGIERDLAGLPVLMPPEGLDIWSTEDPRAIALRSRAERLIRNVRRDHNEGILLPYGWTFTLASTGSRRQFDTNAIIGRYDQRIAVTILADMVLLGGDKVGSFALADVKKSMFSAALEAWLDSITDIFNRYAIPRLFALNAFPGLKHLPTLTHGEVDSPSLTDLARLITSMSGAGFNLNLDTNLENFLRRLAGLPSRDPKMPDPIEEREQNREMALEQANRKPAGPDGSEDSSFGREGGNEDANKAKPDRRVANGMGSVRTDSEG